VPEAWEYREPQGHPQHPPTERVPWQPSRYRQTEHIGRLQPRLPDEPPAAGRQPAFTPAAATPHPQAWQPPPDDPWQASTGQPAAPRYQSPQGYRPPPPPPRYQPPQQPQPYTAPRYPASGPRKKRRVFLWVFLAVQVLFLIWIITGVAEHPAGPTAAQQAAQQCANNGWYPLFKSQADCQVHYANGLNEAGDVGKGLGVAVIVAVWFVVDFFLGLGYGIYRLASRR
jgi:hypothetical protein